MARPLRIEYPGAWYHVMNRGRRKDPIYFSDSDYELFMEVMGEAVKLFGIEIHAFALIPNHYHILIRTPQGNISRAMRHINGVYTQKINLKYKLDGSLFRGRFKSIIVEEEEYLLEVVRYIHRNPIEAKLEERIGEYKWCSHGMYKDKKKRPNWLTTEDVMKKFSKYEEETKENLDAFINKEVPKALMKKLESVKWPTVLGGEKFKKKIDKIIRGKEIVKREVPEYKTWRGEKLLEGKQLKELLEKEKDILEAKKVRKKSIVNKRRALIYVIKEKTQKSNRKISEMIGRITDASISLQYRRAVEEVAGKKGCYKEVKRYLRNLNF
jgi:REP element-mobilizing transposase RayT